MKAILFDLDGVFYTGNTVIPNAPEIVDWVKQQSIPHLFVTNTSSRSRSELVNKLAGFGIYTDAEHIFTPITATKSWLVNAAIKARIALYIPEASKQEFSDFNCCQAGEKPSAIIIGDLGSEWSYNILNQIFRHLMDEPDLPLIALGMTRYWQAEDGLRLDVAPFVKALEYASGAEALVMGKPDPNFYLLALNKLNLPAADVLMIGDDIRGDIDGAQRSGLKAWLVKTGKFRERDLQSGIFPDRIIDTVEELKKYW